MEQTLSDTIFRALVETLPDAVVIASREGKILLVNGQTEALFGYERQELMDQPVETLVPDELHEIHRRHREQYARYPGTRPMGIGLELMGRRKDGSRFPIEIGLSPLVRGQQMFVTAVIRDVTERNRMRGELEMQRDRQRIAMDLHDGTIQSIYAIGLGLELALGDVAGDPVEAGRRIDGSKNHNNTDIQQKPP
jgi:PAS domain S-box-containing protein